ncbi:MAG: ABC transporter substrate-binding protein [Proteobacteria bacterium]|jgi:NitT/TauT family transport system substrate-binding protein|nr:ABC transporter substrate-binding protein [Pseudomonadota bacterium]MBU4229106.1 ABC transporter substrate-binding protein [Pseudomonadota bacterium]MCG2823243.1 ABC transporter substrate-binding protein [Desulfobulbaceae bacterium]MDP2002594.1 ABC transporter substrate-binding protein [Desulfurivibrionaceae bacterium]MDP2757934.1 ABC transporter substrate-binding protein [Desulfurivibrionaceae bacterium]
MQQIRVVLCLTMCLMILPVNVPAGERLIVADTRALLSGLVHLAAQKGYFSEEGVEVQVNDFATGDEATRAMFEGKADIASVAETQLVFDTFREKEFGIFATIGSWDNEVKIVARVDRNITRIEDLRGKTVATQAKFSTHYFLYQAMLKHGLTMADIKPVFKKSAELPAALESGEIDAFSSREPFIGEASQRLGGKVLVFEEPGVYWKSFNLVARNETLKQHARGALPKFLRALFKAEKFVQQQPQEAATIMAKRLNSSPERMGAELAEAKLRLGLEQRLLYTLENVATWAVQEKLVTDKSIPNYLRLIHPDPLLAVKPNVVTVIR